MRLGAIDCVSWTRGGRAVPRAEIEGEMGDGVGLCRPA